LHHIAEAVKAHKQTLIDEANQQESTLLRSGQKCRLVNALFHPLNVQNYFSLNVKKDGKDHESLEGGHPIPKQFWIDIQNTMTEDSMDERDMDLTEWWKPPASDEDMVKVFERHFNGIDCKEKESLERGLRGPLPPSVAEMSTLAMEKIHGQLLRVRVLMKDRMTASGHHSNNPWDYAAAAALTEPGIHQHESYYFFVRCAEYGDTVDQVFDASLPDSARGNSGSTVVQARVDNEKAVQATMENMARQQADDSAWRKEQSQKYLEVSQSIRAEISKMANMQSAKLKMESEKRFEELWLKFYEMQATWEAENNERNFHMMMFYWNRMKELKVDRQLKVTLPKDPSL
jgi:hypothetical protein